MMTTEVSGRIAGRSVFEPFSAHRASTRLKVGPNQGPTAPQERERLQEEPDNEKRGRDMAYMSRPGTIPAGGPGRGRAPGHHHHKGEGAGPIARAPAP